MKKVLILLVAVFALVAVPAFASTFLVGEQVEQKDNIFNDDIYIAGGAVDVSGDIGGDAVLAGGDVSVLGRVNSDISVAGGQVTLTGDIGDDLRVAAGQVSISSRITDDLVAAAGVVKVLSDTRVGGDATIAAGAVFMNGTVVGDLKVYAEEVVLDGPVNGDVELKFTKKVTLLEDAAIAGNLTYSAVEELEVPEGVIIGGEIMRVDSPVPEFNKEKAEEFFAFMLFGKFLVMIITGVLLVLIFKKLSMAIGEGAVRDFWKNALLGFVGLIVTPVLGVVLLVTLFGSYFTVLLAFLYIFLLLLAKAYSGIVVGALLSKWTKKKVIVDWKWAILGIVVAQLVMLVPVIGVLTIFVTCMAGFGTIGTMLYNRVWANR